MVQLILIILKENDVIPMTLLVKNKVALRYNYLVYSSLSHPFHCDLSKTNIEGLVLGIAVDVSPVNYLQIHKEISD